MLTESAGYPLKLVGSSDIEVPWREQKVSYPTARFSCPFAYTQWPKKNIARVRAKKEWPLWYMRIIPCMYRYISHLFTSLNFWSGFTATRDPNIGLPPTPIEICSRNSGLVLNQLPRPHIMKVPLRQRFLINFGTPISTAYFSMSPALTAAVYTATSIRRYFLDAYFLCSRWN